MVPSPYSLGKLIDWKRPDFNFGRCHHSHFGSPYSLGKLIDWKRNTGVKIQDVISLDNNSLLAREIN